MKKIYILKTIFSDDFYEDFIFMKDFKIKKIVGNSEVEFKKLENGDRIILLDEKNNSVSTILKVINKDENSVEKELEVNPPVSIDNDLIDKEQSFYRTDVRIYNYIYNFLLRKVKNMCDAELKLDYNNITCKNLDKNIQSLYFGAPGTGKSHDVKELIQKVYPDIDEKENPFVFKTTIYSDYSYYDFVGNLVPTHNGEKLEYAFKPGIFTQALSKSLNYPEKEIFLVIEEMSRGNIASIFGDIFQLLDRKKDGTSDYSINNDLISNFLGNPIGEGEVGTNIQKITLPRNLHILGTVNTSDQNVNVIDTAFKRRFDFIYSDVAPAKDKKEKHLNDFSFTLGNKELRWNRFYMSLNKLITEWLELPEDKQIGQFFIKFDNYDNNEDKFNAIKNKLLNYLWEDVQSMSIDEGRSIFGSKYKTFSKLYLDFGNKVNIFSDRFIEIYDNSIMGKYDDKKDDSSS